MVRAVMRENGCANERRRLAGREIDELVLAQGRFSAICEIRPRFAVEVNVKQSLADRGERINRLGAILRRGDQHAGDVVQDAHD